MLLSLSLQAETVNLTPNNTVNIRTQIDGASIHKAMMEIVALREKSPTETIYIVLNSPGGDVIAGLEFIRFLDTQENIKTITIFAASMASGIVEANKGERLIVESGVLMFHRARIGLQGQIAEGELESELAFYKNLVEILEVKNADRMDMSLKDYKAKVKDEYWIIGKDAVDKEGADRVVSILCSIELIRSVEETVFATMFGEVKVQFSQCPLFSNPLKIVKPENKKKK